ncbi:alpha/beta hydrolase [Gordonia spumicola]|nr:alpha/beta hydrolase [Gordonia spumicola]
MERIDVTFPSGDAACAAWLYLPDADSTDRPGPVVVMAHGLGGVREERLDAFAERFSAAGYACLVFDYRYFGASGGEPRQLLDVPSQRADWRAAVRYARSLPQIDADRVVVWGTSFSGGHVIVTAAEDRRIAAATAQCPFTDGLASGTAMSPLVSMKIAALAVRDVVGSRLGRPPVMVPTTGEPGTVALMTSPDSVAGVQALIPEGAHIEKDVAARVALQIPLQFPGRQAANVACPLRVVICEQDAVAPAAATRKHVSKAPDVEIVSYDTGHFDIYVGDWFEKNVTEQIDWLRRTVALP